MRTERITVIGGGRMGRGISQLMATEGCSVKLVSRRTSTLESAIEEIRANLILLQRMNLLDGSIEDILGRIELIQGISERRIFDCDFFCSKQFPKNPSLKRRYTLRLTPIWMKGQ